MFQDSNRLNWRDLRGPEKYRLLAKVNLVTLFPSIPNIGDIQEIWADFFKLNASIRFTTMSSDSISAFQADAKSWLQCIYQTTPYIHAMVAHVPEFMTMYGSIVPFTQQGLEKLNDNLTKYFYRISNHHTQDHQALTQVLQKKNRLTYLTDSGCQRKKRHASHLFTL